jgi:methionyl-tRNA synthetase
LLWPFIPSTSEKIAKHFGFEIEYDNLDKLLNYKNIKKSEILFKKIEFEEKKLEQKPEIKKETKIQGIKNMADIINYEQFSKVDLRVGTIKKAEDIEGADKLLKLEVDLGKEIGKRTILAGIKKYYSKEELKGKQIIVVVNLETRKMKGMESQGMLLAAVSSDESKVILLSPEKKSENGWKIM